MKKIRCKSAIVVAVAIVLSLIVPIWAMAAEVGGRSITSQGAIVIDFETGIVLYGHQEDEQRVPASMIKMLTIYVIYDAIKAGEISFDTAATISRGVDVFSQDREFANIRLREGWEVTIEELLGIVILRSANAATVALAEALSGSESAFIERMEEKGEELGIDMQIYDCFGGSPNNRISPRGVADLVRYLLIDHPEVIEMTAMRSVSFRGTNYTNTNSLLGDYPGLDGLKTGFTTPAGYCFVGTAVQDERRIIAVTMGSTQASRFQDTRRLLDYGFSVAESVVAEYLAEYLINSMSGWVEPSDANLIIDGKAMPLTAYNIGGYHYFKLRDIAYLLNDTEKRFSVTWNEEESSISLVSGESYIAVGGELDISADEPRWFTPTFSSILFNGAQLEFDAYLVGDNNYFMLRELAPLLDIQIDWEPETETVIIITRNDDNNEETFEDTEDKAAEDDAQEETASEDSAPEDNAHEGSASEDIAPEDDAHEGSASVDVAPDDD